MNLNVIVVFGISKTSFGCMNKKHKIKFQKLTKCSTVVWVILALVVAKVTRFFPILLGSSSNHNTDDNDNDNNNNNNNNIKDAMNMHVVKPLLYASLVGMGIITILVLYLVLYLPRVKGITDSSAWDVYCPRVIPTLTAVGIVTALMMIRSVWPVWGFLSPLILGVEAFGFLFFLHFVPWI